MISDLFSPVYSETTNFYTIHERGETGGHWVGKSGEFQMPVLIQIALKFILEYAIRGARQTRRA